MSDAEIMASAGIVDAALQMAGNITASTFNYKHTKELAQWQNDMNVANWKMANEYNTPANQMKRFEEAGLNPNLMYGQGNPGNAGTVAAASAGSHNEVRNPFAGVQFANLVQQTRSMALDNEMKRLKNDEEYSRLFQAEQNRNAIMVFQRDKLNGHKDEKGSFVYGDDYRYRNNPAVVDYDHLRQTATYQKLEQLWQRGIINEKNIGLIDAKTGLIGAQEGALGFNEERSKLLMDVLEGDFDMSKLLKLIVIQLINSSTSPGVVTKFF